MSSIDKPLTLAAALHALGSTQDAVATTLTAGGWKGTPLQAAMCPVAAYLTAMGFCLPVVDQAWSSHGADWTTQQMDTPDAVADFISAFDREEYPQLIATRDTLPPPDMAKTEPAPAPEMGAAE